MFLIFQIAMGIVLAVLILANFERVAAVTGWVLSWALFLLAVAATGLGAIWLWEEARTDPSIWAIVSGFVLFVAVSVIVGAYTWEGFRYAIGRAAGRLRRGIMGVSPRK